MPSPTDPYEVLLTLLADELEAALELVAGVGAPERLGEIRKHCEVAAALCTAIRRMQQEEAQGA